MILDKRCTVFPSVYSFMNLKELRVLSYPKVYFLFVVHVLGWLDFIYFILLFFVDVQLCF